jgi:hypothetical protein
MPASVSTSGIPGWLHGGEEELFIFRGVRRSHEFYEEATDGIARPGDPNGHADPLRHNRGFTKDSPFTSWTTDYNVAKDQAGPDGVVLRLPYGEPPPDAGWRFVASPDRFRESEVLVQGLVTSATVIRP